MKVSIITVTLNSSKTIEHCIRSVNNQKYNDIEHVFIDGASNDHTLDIINAQSVKPKIIISEPDNGIYQAMNKGIRLATGDIVGILNADDFFTNENVISRIVSCMKEENVDGVYGDVKFVDQDDTSKIIRYYSSKNFAVRKFKYGFMPAHPSFYVRRKHYTSFGLYKEDYQIAADYELLIRFMKFSDLKFRYLEMPFVSMRTGGISNQSITSRIILNKEIIRACRENGISTNVLNVYSKYFLKVFEYRLGKKNTEQKTDQKHDG